MRKRKNSEEVVYKFNGALCLRTGKDKLYLQRRWNNLLRCFFFNSALYIAKETQYTLCQIDKAETSIGS